MVMFVLGAVFGIIFSLLCINVAMWSRPTNDHPTNKKDMEE